MRDSMRFQSFVGLLPATGRKHASIDQALRIHVLADHYSNILQNLLKVPGQNIFCKGCEWTGWLGPPLFQPVIGNSRPRFFYVDEWNYWNNRPYLTPDLL